MCGILGISWDKKFFDSTETETFRCLFENSLNYIKHRGPDDIGTFYNLKKQIALGHTRLSIIDLSDHGKQPMISDDKNYVLSFNGEIYNFKTLKKKLIKKGFIFKTNTDTEVLLNLYICYGISMVKKLDGIFSFAIWDNINETLFVSKDTFGIKPLYYFLDKGKFMFSSEIKPLIKFLSDKKKINIHTIEKHLTFLWSPGNQTPLEKIFKVEPGEYLIIKKGKIVNRVKWYTPPINLSVNKSLNKLELIKDVRKNLRKAVHKQMISDVPLGAFLSGGLDSSSVVAFAKEIDPNIACFTIKTLNQENEGFVDDLPYARRVAKKFNLNLEEIEISADQLFNNLNFMIKTLEEPIADPAALNVYYITKRASEKGIKVMLSGTGGDDIFTGYRRHVAINYEEYWKFIPSIIKKNVRDLIKIVKSNNPKVRRISKLLNGVSLNEEDRLVDYFVWTNREDILCLLSENYKNKIKDNNFKKPFLDHLNTIKLPKTTLEKMLSLEQRFFLGDHNLIYTDKMSMANSVEVRVPFLDKNLVDLASKIPNYLLQKRTESKWILKKSMETILPKDIIYRSKTGFGAPIRSWVKNELRDSLNYLLSAKSIKKRGIFNAKAVRELIDRNHKNIVDGSYTIFSLLCIEIWCKEFLDK